MSLTLDQRPSGIWRIRGTVQGIRIDQSAKTRSRAEAAGLRDRLYAQIVEQAIYGQPAKTKKTYTFADAAIGYLESGRASQHYYLDQVIAAFGETPLRDITQGLIDKKAQIVFPTQKASTQIRHFYGPVGKILNFAAGERWGPWVRVARPKVKKTRPDWRTPEEIEALISVAGDFANMLIFLVGTGARSQEARTLRWRDVSIDNSRVTFWSTKSGHARSVDLCDRTRGAIPKRPRAAQEKFVWMHSAGRAWASKDTLRQKIVRLCETHNLPPCTPHTFRHTWASWQYAQTPDLLRLMTKGGWQDQSMVQRYTHLGTPDLAAEVNKYNWFRFGQNLGNSTNKKQKTQ